MIFILYFSLFSKFFIAFKLVISTNDTELCPPKHQTGCWVEPFEPSFLGAPLVFISQAKHSLIGSEWQAFPAAVTTNKDRRTNHRPALTTNEDRWTNSRPALTTNEDRLTNHRPALTNNEDRWTNPRPALTTNEDRLTNPRPVFTTNEGRWTNPREPIPGPLLLIVCCSVCFSGWRRRRRARPSASRTPTSLCHSTRTPARCCRRGTRWGTHCSTPSSTCEGSQAQERRTIVYFTSGFYYYSVRLTYTGRFFWNFLQL